MLKEKKSPPMGNIIIGIGITLILIILISAFIFLNKPATEKFSSETDQISDRQNVIEKNLITISIAPEDLERAMEVEK